MILGTGAQCPDQAIHSDLFFEQGPDKVIKNKKGPYFPMIIGDDATPMFIDDSLHVYVNLK